MLAQRNALLARIRAGRASHATLPTWDRELAARRARAARRTAPRRSTCSPSRSPSAPHSSACSGERRARVPAALARQRGAASSSPSCASACPGDLERGFTGHGPHRDELAILRDGRELRVYGSQGEQRLALLALLLAERAVLAARARRTRR